MHFFSLSQKGVAYILLSITIIKMAILYDNNNNNNNNNVMKFKLLIYEVLNPKLII